MTGKFTLFTATVPRTLGKVYRLGPSGLEKQTAGELSEASFEVLSFNTIDQFAVLIGSVSTAQAISSSIPLSGSIKGKIVAKARAVRHPEALTRTAKDFGFPNGTRGVIVLDYDARSDTLPLTQAELWKMLTTIAPAVANAGVLWWCSGSSHIFNDDEKVYGLRGQRLYLMVADTGDTERVGEVLMKRLWLNGYGYIAISSSGQRLERADIDSAMFQPARLDFAGGAECKPPLVQRRGTPIVLAAGSWLDTTSAIENLTPDEETRYVALVSAAYAKAAGAAQEARERWKESRRDTAISSLSSTGMTIAEASERVDRSLSAALGGVLLGDFDVRMAGGEAVKIGTILDNRERFHGALTLDPLEPDYANGKVTGKLFLYGASPTLHSFARGGTTYRLRRQPHRLYMQRGRKAELADEILKALAEEPDVFIRGESLVVMEDGRMRPLRKHNLAHLIGTRAALYVKNDKGLDLPVDVPNDVVEMVIAMAEG
ncbi:hypothetical protein ACFFTM_01785 [Pseudoduganella plicata]|uniref:Uncharacterized protein n=1 Tax=Pseudoduganella plicata TaxID=321984 RepID=A0A4P7BEY1_9BURK|nr:hypothetical protein [Pseudoduganella plicata]QBQ36743.1 hypothetical protein E1742_11625 [Pseudoduganella plicata]GGY73082.1 hypothetical protein GCM10007388_01430 [Pseudoduganella plicata]